MEDRRNEWFVPRFGPPRFRTLVGLLFLPYTGMVLAFAAIGSVVAESLHWDRLLVTVFVYLFGLGIAAHALDAIGASGRKPWGAVLSRKRLWMVAVVAMVLAYGLAIPYMILYVPWLWIVAVLEGFFLLAYNLEWFGGRFHSDGWFAFSWGFLPVVAGYVMQTNSIAIAPVVLGVAAALFSLVEITASRPYKELRRLSDPGEAELGLIHRYEKILKAISLGVITLGVGLLIYRLVGTLMTKGR